MNGSNGRDDKTQLVPNLDGADKDRTIIPGQPQGPGGGLGGLQSPPLRGTVIGGGPNPGPGQRPPLGQAPGPVPQPGARPAPDAGATMFVVPQPASSTPGSPLFDPVVGWITVVKGPGRGCFKPVFYGSNSIGRGPDQRIQVDFGDQRISRETHAYIVYDDVQREYYLRDNGKSNLVRHNGSLVMAPTQIKDRDRITVGDTVLMFIALCNADFDWLAGTDEPNKA